jgi:hypothetical protein
MGAERWDAHVDVYRNDFAIRGINATNIPWQPGRAHYIGDHDQERLLFPPARWPGESTITLEEFDDFEQDIQTAAMNSGLIRNMHGRMFFS